jgi:hypothetical protein
VVAGARRDSAPNPLAAARAADAADLARQVVGAEPYAEEGWRLLMRSRAGVAGPGAVVPTFLECAERLEEVGLTPSPQTRELMERLRRPSP